jgi:peptide/nickel transport system permease protein
MVAVMGLALALILLAQGLDRVFNPRVRTRLAGESRSTADDGDDEGGVTN